MEKQDNHKVSFIRKFFVILLLVFIGILLYSHFIGTKGLRVREYAVINSKLTDSYHGLKIVHFSDLHYGTTVKKDEFSKIVDQINKLKPDLIFFTGDLIDKRSKVTNTDLLDVINILDKLDPQINIFMVRGNHDYINNYNEVMRRINIQILENSSEFIYYQDSTPILIVGLEDYLEGTQDINKAFEKYSEEYYTILLAHEPDTVKKLGDFKPDLVLSGHSHNGQVSLPFVGSIVKVDGAKFYYEEKYVIDNTSLYISGGLGTSKYPFRLFNKPSINFFRLYNK